MSMNALREKCVTMELVLTPSVVSSAPVTPASNLQSVEKNA